jgi:hypothetical protein
VDDPAVSRRLRIVTLTLEQRASLAAPKTAIVAPTGDAADGIVTGRDRQRPDSGSLPRMASATVRGPRKD